MGFEATSWEGGRDEPAAQSLQNAREDTTGGCSTGESPVAPLRTPPVLGSSGTGARKVAVGRGVIGAASGCMVAAFRPRVVGVVAEGREITSGAGAATMGRTMGATTRGSGVASGAGGDACM